MHLNKAMANLESLTEAQLQHHLQLANHQIDNYMIIISNYSPEMMMRYGLPHLAKLRNIRDLFVEELAKRNE